MTDPHALIQRFLNIHGLSVDEAPSLEKWQGVLRVLMSELGHSVTPWQRQVLALQWPIFITDAQGIIKSWNAGCQELFGYSDEVLGQPVQTLLPTALEGVRLQGMLRQVAGGERLLGVELRYLPPGGTPQVMLCHMAPLPGLLGHEVDIVFTCTPLSADTATRRSRHDFYESLLEALPAPIAIFDASQRYVFCNKAAIKNPEVRQWIIGKNDREYVEYRHFDPAIADQRERFYQQAVREGRTVSFEEEFRTPENETIYQLRTFTPIYSADGDLLMNIGHGLEITALKRAEQALVALNNELEERVRARTAQLEAATRQIQHDAFHDRLTGLPNRALFNDRLDQAMTRFLQPEGGPQYAVLFLDTDRFKAVNDSLGRPAGDALLRELASRLRGTLRASDTVARQGGDEFTVLMEPVTSEDQVLQVVERLGRELRQPITLGSDEVSVSVSVGIVMGERSQQSAAEVLRDADIAMYRAKAAGRGGYQVFRPEMREQTIRQGRLEQELRAALARDELRVHYQPIIELKTGLVSGFEALVRWEHPSRGLIGPGEFLHVAQESGLTQALDRWVLRRACLDMGGWQREHPRSRALTLSVNFGAEHFSAPDTVNFLRDTLLETGFDPSRLHIEVTEGVLLGQPQTIGRTLEDVQALGIELHLDDFGTGYSSLSYLLHYPLNTLKIDRSFVVSMLESSSSAELVRTIIAMSKNMRLCAVAEGVENAEQWRILQELGCEYGQGYFFSRPLPLPEACLVVKQLDAQASNPEN